MISDTYICYDVEAVSPETTVAEALVKMRSQHLDLLPVLQADRLCNYVSVEELESRAGESRLSELPLFAPVLPVVRLRQHLLDTLTHLKTLNLSLMAVLDDDGHYQGVLKTRDVVKALSLSLSIKSTGSILVLRIKPIDYSLSDLSRVLEYSDAKVLGLFVFELEETGELELHVKLNTTLLKHVLATLERYDYRVVQYFNREDFSDDNDQRFENLMKYIDV